MTDHETLREAFTELERRADEHPHSNGVPHRGPGRSRYLLVAASVLAVLAVAVGITFFARAGLGPNKQTAGDPGSASAAGPSATASVGPGTDSGTPTPTESPKSTATASGFQLPDNPKDLADRFRTVLHSVVGDSSSFTVTDTGQRHADDPPDLPAGGVRATAAGAGLPPPAQPSGAAIVGTLTASGVTGGYDIQIFADDPGSTASCDDPDKATCTVRRLPDGSSLAIGSEQLANTPKGRTYQAELIRPDGTTFLMHVSNERDPKGESAVLSPDPVLTTEQMTAIVTSDRW